MVMGLTKLDCFLKEKVEEAGLIPGAVLLVRHRDEMIFHEAYGFRETVPSKLPMTKDTLFDLASLTKPVSTALLVMQMWQQGRIRLEQTLSHFFAHLKNPAKRRITVGHLLANRSGFPAWRPYYQNYTEAICPISRDEMFNNVVSEKLEVMPGEREIYSDLGYMLLGWILEQATKIDLDRLFQQEISGPMALEKTGYRRIREDPEERKGADEPIAATERCPWRSRVLRGEVHDENGYLLGGVAGHAGLFSTAKELDLIVSEVFRGFRKRSDLFRQDALNTFFQRPPGSSSGTWALGWDTPSPTGSTSGRYFSKNSFGHTGFTGTSLWMDLDRKISVIFLTNRVHPNRENDAIKRLRPQVHDMLMEEILFSGSGRSKTGDRV